MEVKIRKMPQKAMGYTVYERDSVRGKSYYCTIRVANKSLGLKSKQIKLTDRSLPELKKRIKSIKYGYESHGVEQKPKSRQRLFSDTYDEYEAERRKHFGKLKRSTQMNTLRTIKAHRKKFGIFEDMILDDISTETVKEWQEEILLQKTVKEGGLRTYTRTLMAFFNWCYERELMHKRIRSKQLLKLSTNSSPHDIKTYNDEEFKKFLQFLDPESGKWRGNRADKKLADQKILFYKVLYYTGIRPSEAVALRIRDVAMTSNDDKGVPAIHIRMKATRDLDNNVLYVEQLKTAAAFRSIPIYPELMNDLITMASSNLQIKEGEDDEDCLIFPDIRYKAVTTAHRQINERIRRYYQQHPYEEEIPTIKLYEFRKSFITRLNKRTDIPLSHKLYLAGHTKYDVELEHYIKRDDMDMVRDTAKEVFDKMYH